ncbi:MAG: F0F1 ATP synthase subunit gamma [Pseudomonadota bacterium]
MPSLKDLKNRIESVKSTRKITKAMQMVAAAKLRRAQESAEAARPYAERMNKMLGNLALAAKDSPTAPKLLKGSESDQTHLIVVCTAERGLCGGFNSQIVRKSREVIDGLEGNGKTVKILTVGRKGRDQLKRFYAEKFVGHVDLQGVKRIGYDNAAGVAEDISKRFFDGEFDVCTLVFSRFKSVISQIPTPLGIIPPELPEVEETDSDGPSVIYEIEPDEEAVLAELLPKNMATQIFMALLENAASEQGARMAAMDSATRNAGDMINRLNLEYNRSRQAAITKELIEIISGAEAL